MASAAQAGKAPFSILLRSVTGGLKKIYLMARKRVGLEAMTLSIPALNFGKLIEFACAESKIII